MIELIEKFGIWVPGIIVILSGIVWSLSLARSRNRDEEKTNFKIIRGEKTERVASKDRKAA